MSIVLKKLSVLIFTIFTISLLINLVVASEEESAITSQQALLLLKGGNDRFAADQSNKNDIGQTRRTKLVKGQHPFAIVLTCADSRVPPELIFNQGLGDIFVLRVAGNIADPFVLGSIEYAVEHLHVPLLVVLGHDKCGAVGAALSPEKPAGNLGALISEVYVGQGLPEQKEAAQSAAVKNNVMHQLELITSRSEVLKKSADEKKLSVVPAIYHLESGKVEWLGDK